MVDAGTYNKDQELYKSLVEQIYARYPDGITLTPEYAEFVQENTMSLLVRLARYKFVARQLKASDRVLEVGSGSGLGCTFLGQHCEAVIGLDIKTTEVDEARSLCKRDNVKFQVGDIFGQSASHDFDCVVALDVIEHMDTDMGRKLIAAMARQLKSDGFLVIGTPSIHSYPHQGALSQASHVKCYDLPELVEVITEHFGRTFAFSMNDEVVHSGHHKMAWYYFVLGTCVK
ncbi:MAG: class I SAM-dependent methyltransferase [Sedimenticola sp.]